MRCPKCESRDIDLIEWLPDGRRDLVCLTCDHRWIHGEARVVTVRADSRQALKQRLPRPDAIDPAIRERVEALKTDFLARHPEPKAEVIAFWAKYQQVFSKEGLWACDPQDLKDFANSPVGARPGIMAGFNAKWNEMGTEAAARRTRETIDYLLYRDEATPLEDRLTRLIRGGVDFGMPGFRESLLTKVLCIARPDDFLPILRYSTEGTGKREVAASVFQMHLPDPESVNWTIGRLAIRSNDLLLEALGGGFAHKVHAAKFLWEAKDKDKSGTVGS